MGFNGLLWDFACQFLFRPPRSPGARRFYRSGRISGGCDIHAHQIWYQSGVVPSRLKLPKIVSQGDHGVAQRHECHASRDSRGGESATHGRVTGISMAGRVARMACKPDSVTAPDESAAADGHSSGPAVAGGLVRPTRIARAGETLGRLAAPRAIPIWPCSWRGLPCRRRCRRRGGLLPHRFTLALRPEGRRAVWSLWRFPSGRPGRALPAAISPWSPDFPRPCGRGHPAIRAGPV